MRLLIESRSTGDSQIFRLTGVKVSIGRDENCEICLPSPFVSKRHAELEIRDKRLFLHSVGLNPTIVNGDEITQGTEKELVVGDTIYVQGYMIGVEEDADTTSAEAAAIEAHTAFSRLVEEFHNAIIGRLDPRVVRLDKIDSVEGRKTILAAIDDELRKVDVEARPEVMRHAAKEALRASVMRRILGGEALVQDGLTLGQEAGAFGTHEEARDALIDAIVADLQLHLTKVSVKEDIRKVRDEFDAALEKRKYDLAPGLHEHLTRWVLCKEACDMIFGLGPLTDLLQMPDINEIMVVAKDQIYIEKDGVLEETGRRFFNDKVSERIIERIVGPVGRQINRSTPMVDARLMDGSRVNAIIPPLALKGPCITIRKFSPNPLTIDDLVGFGALDARAAGFLRACVKGRKNMVISGGTGSGKTTLLNALSGWIFEHERVVTIEDNAELRLQQRHVVTLEAKPANIEGRGEITIRDLVRNALRMRPDRIIVGECRGREALDMLQAMNTGHDGSMTTGHANTPRDMLNRLEVMALEAGDLPVMAIRQQIGAALDVIVQQARLRDGSRKIIAIAEVVGYDMDEGQIIMEDVYFRKPGRELAFTGYLPTFMEDLVASGLAQPEDIFV